MVREEVRKGGADALLVVRGRFPDGLSVEWQSAKLNVLAEAKRIEAAVSRMAMRARAEALGLDAGVVDRLAQPVAVREVHLGAKAAGERELGFKVGLVFVMLMIMYMGIIVYGAFVFQGALEEKTSRVMEVLVSAVRPFPMMAAKIVALGALGLTQFLIAGSVLGVLMATGMALTGVDTGVLRPALIGYLAVVFLLGYFLYAALFAAAGSLVSRVEDSQATMAPVMMTVIISYFVSEVAVFDPDGRLAAVLSFIPFFTPTVMFARIVMAPPPAWQVGRSVLLLAAAVVGVMWLAGRIYRVGVLSYGIRPSLRDVVRFLQGV